MVTPKSHTEFFLGLYDSFLRKDMVRQYGNPASFDRDYITISSRVKKEGFSFLSKTLPALGKALDTALQTGTFIRPLAFKKARKGTFPAVMQVLFERVFDQDGSLKNEPCVSAISDLRQACYFAYKYEVPYEEKLIEKFLDNFVTTDEEVGETPSLDSRSLQVITVARTLLDRVVSKVDVKNIIPKHGPGAVATGEKNWEKMNFTRKYGCIHSVYPYYKFFYSNAMDLASQAKQYWKLETIPSGISSVCLVPKDSRGPRLICMEPLEFQWVQQGLARNLVDGIEVHPFTRGHVNFRNQEINRSLALRGSCSADEKIVTLDMKEASDRVSYWLVERLFEGTDLLPKLLGTRTEATELPNGRVLLMQKFAPMGSALCFPVEALVHWALAVSTLHVHDGVSLKRAMSAVYVYGDDIIIKGQNHEALFDQFPKFHLKFNEGKCCTSGIFRESCGMDAVLGQSVTPIKIKKPLPNKPYDAEGYVSYLECCNALWERAYYSSSKLVEEYLRSIYRHLPHVPNNSDTPGLVTRVVPPKEPQTHVRYNKALQCKEYRVRQTVTRKIMRDLDRSEYQRSLLNSSQDFFFSFIETT